MRKLIGPTKAEKCRCDANALDQTLQPLPDVCWIRCSRSIRQNGRMTVTTIRQVFKSP
ncbi:hypothetical protein ACLK1T_17950 [Escherichia coli]